MWSTLTVRTATCAVLLSSACNFSVDSSLTNGGDSADAEVAGENGDDAGSGNNGGPRRGTSADAGASTVSTDAGTTTGLDQSSGGQSSGGTSAGTGSDSGGTTGGTTNGSAGGGNDGAPSGTNNGTTGEITAGTTGGATAVTTGGTVEPQDLCKTDSNCSENQVCMVGTSGGRECTDRCEAGGTCFGTEHGEREVFFASDGSSTCYTLSATKDQDGLGMLRNAAVFAWNMAGAPVQIAGGLARAQAKLLVDGQCYVVTANGLARVAVDGQSAVQSLDSNNTNIAHVWSTSQHVWWSTNDNSGQNAELFRIARTKDAVVERLKSDGIAWRTGNSTRLFRFNTGFDPYVSRVESAPTDEPGNVTTLRTEAMPLFADDSALYVQADYEQNQSFIERVDLTGTNKTTRVSRRIESPLIEGDWMYWFEVQSGTSQLFNRYFRVSTKQTLQEEEEVLRFSVTADTWWTGFTVVKNHIVHTRQGRIVAIPIAGSSCGSTIGCSFGTTCALDMTCK